MANVDLSYSYIVYYYRKNITYTFGQTPVRYSKKNDVR